MFRPNTGVDLNDFPVLGTPASSNRNNLAPSLSPSSNVYPNTTTVNSNTRISYASTAGTPFSNGPFNQQNGIYQQDSLSASAAVRSGGGGGGGNTTALLNQRTFSMDDFPALNSNDNGFIKQHSQQQQQSLPPPPQQQSTPIQPQQPQQREPWGSDFNVENTNSSNNIPTLNGSAKQFKNEGISSQWTQGRTDVGQLQRRENEQDNVSASMWSENSNNIGKSSNNITNNSNISESNNQSQGSDPYGLLGLLGVIRMTDPDRSMLALGSDLTTLGLDLNTADSIYSTFISPWSDTQTPQGLHVEPGFYLPPCYRQVQAMPAAHQRMRTFSDEILFYVFYCMPKDIVQEAAAQELYARNWRYHKELGLWLTKETDENGRPVQTFRRTSANGVDRGVYVFFDPTTWQKVKREWTLSWDSIEERYQQQANFSSSNTSQQPLSNPPPPPGSSMSNRGVMI